MSQAHARRIALPLNFCVAVATPAAAFAQSHAPASIYSGPRKLDHRLSYSGGPAKGA
jgi:hypothetical protein